MKLKLPEGLKLGVATAATQTEGGVVKNNWYQFYMEGGIKDNASPVNANDHYNRVAEDTDLMAELGLQCFRMGVEWARIEPNQNEFNQEAIQHYVDEIAYVKSRGIEVLLTLHHFSNPLWFENLGGWQNPKSPEIFLNFVKNFVPFVADKVNLFVTVNEPNVYAYNSFFSGVWYPNKKSLRSLGKVYGNFVKTHILCYNFLHKLRKEKGFNDTLVSFANHLRIFTPKNPKSKWHNWCKNLAEKLFQTSITHAMMTGECAFPVQKQDVEIGKYYDFIGINYYSRSTISGLSDGVNADAATNDLGWEIFPEGIAILAKQLYEKYGTTVFITENGTCDKADSFRAKYIFDHLHSLVNSGVPVLRYYHWTFIDNWEWAEGESAPFGLVENDFKKQTRTIRQSGHFYADIIKNGGVTEEAFEKYVAEK